VIDIIRFDHISMAVPELDPQIELLEGLFGFRYAGKFVEESEGYVGANFEIPGNSDLSWEVLEPYGEESYLHRFLAGVSGPGLHHLAVQVRDIQQTVAALRAEGIEPWGAEATATEPGQPVEATTTPASAPTELTPIESAPPVESEPVGFAPTEVAPTEVAPAAIEQPAEAGPASFEPPASESEGSRGAESTRPEPPRPESAADDPARGTVYIHPRSGGNGFLFQLFAGPAWHRSEPFVDDREHTLGIIAVNHLSHAHPSRDELGSWYERVFGMETFHRSPASVEGGNGVAGPGFATQVLETSTRQLRMEILEPAGPESFVQQFIDQRGPAMHHIAFEVGDWDRAIEACLHREVPIFGERGGETNGVPWREAFIHPRYTGGVLAQFFWQAEPNVWI
jgi:catechol 2,3-dioxygenase-like lactoylglutathione lyase family enzyme